MSSLHNLADTDPIWDAIYGSDEFAHYNRSETDPIMRVVADELRRQAHFYETIAINRGTSRGVQTGNKAFYLVARHLRDRADKLTGASPSPLPGGEEK